MRKALALFLVLGAASAAESKPRIAVLDFAANGASKELASAAGGVAANELDRLGAFQVITSEAIRNMLAFEKQRQMLGCADSGCIAEIGGALGVDYVISGKVSRIAAAGGAPETVTLELTLSSVRKAQREGSAIETGTSEAELMKRVGRAAQKLVAKLLSGRSGRLVVNSTEAGAVVKVDDQVKGTTPLQGQIVLPAGPHTLAVEKQGFVTYQRDVQVEASKVAEERATLVPSPDFIKDYESRQGKLRMGAWVATGLAVVGVGVAVWGQVDANRLYGNETTPGSFLYDRRKLQDGVETENGVDLRAQASSLKSRIEGRQTLSIVSGVGGGLMAIAATGLWIAGDDPSRYARYRETASLDVVPLPGGAFASAMVRF